jgi:hypothetical protein
MWWLPRLLGLVGVVVVVLPVCWLWAGPRSDYGAGGPDSVHEDWFGQLLVSMPIALFLVLVIEFIVAMIRRPGSDEPMTWWVLRLLSLVVIVVVVLPVCWLWAWAGYMSADAGWASERWFREIILGWGPVVLLILFALEFVIAAFRRR